jgi:hypothetical protein
VLSTAVRKPSGAMPSSTLLCTRCQNFNIQSFASGSTRTRGYRFGDVKCSSELEPPCQFCALLFDAVKSLRAPLYFTSSAAIGRSHPIADPELYVHMTLSEDYGSARARPGSQGLGGNRLLVEIGDRFGEVRERSEHEICLAAEPGELVDNAFFVCLDADEESRQCSGDEWGYQRPLCRAGSVMQ